MWAEQLRRLGVDPFVIGMAVHTPEGGREEEEGGEEEGGRGGGREGGRGGSLGNQSFLQLSRV